MEKNMPGKRATREVLRAYRLAKQNRDKIDLQTKVSQDRYYVMVKWSEVKSLSCVWLFVTLWTVAHQALPSMGFSRKEYWSGLPFPSPGDLPNPEIKPGFPALQADALTSELPGKPKASIKLEDVTVINVPKTEL